MVLIQLQSNFLLGVSVSILVLSVVDGNVFHGQHLNEKSSEVLRAKRALPRETTPKANDVLLKYVCEHNKQRVECEGNSVIHLLKASYGRTSLTTCDQNHDKKWRVDCFNNNKTEAIVKNTCDGKRICDVKASNSVFGDSCPGTIKYLEVKYLCSPAENKPISTHVCEHSNLRMECDKGKMIHLLEANYGRTTFDKCTSYNLNWNLNCASDKAEEIIRENCDRKPSCDVAAYNSIFGDPCPGTIKYIEMQYYCAPADSPPPIHACENGKLHVECYKGSVIQLLKANYGRTSLDKCDKDRNQRNVQCVNDKTEQIVREVCDGKRSCDLTATNSVFGDPCYGTIKYLEMQYLCVPDKAAITNKNTESTTEGGTSYHNSPPSIHACENGKLHVECYKGSVIQLLKANYGRTSLDKCDKDRNHMRNIQCVNDKTEQIVREVCDGKRSCDLTATNSVFGDPCYGTIKYLEMQYLCVPIVFEDEVAITNINTESTTSGGSSYQTNEMLSMYACEHKILYLECGEGNGIRTLQANYGRTSPVKCDEKRSEQWNVNCVNNMTEDIVRKVCDGKSSCEVAASNSVFGDPCFGTIKYLEVQYSCTPDEFSTPRTISNTERITTEKTTFITKQTNSKYACEDSNLHLECEEGNGIRTLQANYGRTSLMKCDEKRAETWSVNCLNNKTEEIVRNLCHGKRSCNVAATNSVFGDSCFGTIKYLEMQYMCVPEGVSTTIPNSEWDTPEETTPQHEPTSTHVCEDNNLHVGCGKDKVIHVFKANYGRTSLTKCMQKYYKQWSVDCATHNTKQIVRNECDGKLSCDVAASNHVFGDPCFGTIKYLEVQYLCAPENGAISVYVCENDNLHAECGSGNVIHLLQANYGRTSLNTCNTHNNMDWNVNCISIKSEEIVRDKCDGKRSCDVAATNSVFGDSCYGTIKYLEMQYLCVPDEGATTMLNTGTTSEETTYQATTISDETEIPYSTHSLTNSIEPAATNSFESVSTTAQNIPTIVTEISKTEPNIPRTVSTNPRTSVSDNPRFVSDNRRILSTIPSTLSDNPRTVSTIPKIRTVSYNPRTVSTIPRTRTVSYNPRTVSTIPRTRTVNYNPRTVPRTVSDNPRTVPTNPRTVSDYPRTVSTIQINFSSYPRTAYENPTTVSDYPRTVSENDRTDTDIAQIFSEIPKTLYDIATETMKYATSIISEETNAPTVKSSEPRTTECSIYNLECFKFECPNDFGSYLHPTSSRMFIVCINWKPTIKTCGQGQVLSEKLMKCVSENSWWSRWGGTRGQQPQFRK